MAKRKPPKPTTLAIADRLAPEMRRRFLAAVRELSASVPIEALIAAVASRNAEAIDLALRLSRLPQSLQPAVKVVSDAFQRSGIASAGLVGESAGATFRFDLVNPAAVQWINQRGAKLVVDITADARRTVRELLARGIQDGVTPESTARLIRDSVGLHDRFATAVANYRQELIAKGRTAEAVDRLTARYSRKLLNYRARVIALNETLEASSAGQAESWRQARQAGLIQPERTQRVWRTSDDDRVCPICSPMDGQVVAFEGEPFVTGEGLSVDRPPAHVLCRCDTRLKFVKAAAA